MANRVVVQPNGLYARFSDVVDNFTHVNCSRAEMRDIYSTEEGLGDVQAEIKIQKAESDSTRFDECIKTIRLIHGKDAISDLIIDLSRPPASSD